MVVILYRLVIGPSPGLVLDGVPRSPTGVESRRGDHYTSAQVVVFSNRVEQGNNSREVIINEI